MSHEVVSVSEDSSAVRAVDCPCASTRSAPDRDDGTAPSLYVGVDPDLRGGMVGLHHPWQDPLVYPTCSISIVSNNKRRKKIDIKKLIFDIRSLIHGIPQERISVHIESAPVYNNGVVAAKTIGNCLGIWEAAFASVCPQASVQLIHPKVWQSNFTFLKGLKGKERKSAIYNFAKIYIQSHFQHNSTCTGIADAYMIACYCRDTFKDRQV